VGVTSPDGTLDKSGGTDDVLPWASVSKLVTAYTVLMAVDEGLVGFDEEAGPEGATVRHLLAHASGLPPEGGSPMAEPGMRRIYSNRGYEILGELLEDRTRIPLPELVAENVFEPLGMTGTRLAGSPASGVEGPLSDLLAFGREQLAPTLVSEDLHSEAVTTVFEGLEGILPGFGRQSPNDWGLGFEIRDGKAPHWTGAGNSPATFGHFGMSGSFLWVDPDARLACGCLADGEFGDWAVEAWPPFADAVLDKWGG
jgi:CubicO group peptidase (beta-lactamase class C family)